MHCLYGGYNLHRFSDALGLVVILYIFFSFARVQLVSNRQCTIFRNHHDNSTNEEVYVRVLVQFGAVRRTILKTCCDPIPTTAMLIVWMGHWPRYLGIKHFTEIL